VIRAADTSQGPALARWRLVEPLLRNGEPVQASPRMVPCARRYYFVCPPEYLDAAKIRTFRDWLQSACEASGSPPRSGAGVS